MEQRNKGSLNPPDCKGVGANPTLCIVPYPKKPDELPGHSLKRLGSIYKDSMNSFFTSDTHFGHKNVIRYCKRPFSTLEEMDEALIENWNSTVGKDDVVWLLGDFCLCPSKDILGYFNRLHGHKYLVMGNHDNKSKSYYKKIGFLDVFDYVDIFGLHLCHYPREGDSQLEDRYKHKRPKVLDKWILCGHVHDNWKIKDNCLNVGVDVNDFKPISLEQVQDEIRREEQKRKWQWIKQRLQ